MSAATVTTRAPLGAFRSKRLLSLAGDERLVEQIRRGNELAFEVAFERYGAGILGFCRHMLGSVEEAEDAVQHTFAAAFRDLRRGGDRAIALRAWLYTIARNRCISVLRARREQAAPLDELPTEGLGEQVQRRAELRELLSDVRELPKDQRAALLLAEAAGLSHAEVAEVLGCEAAAVKGIVFRARSGLIERRAARETPCGEIREQLATLRGGALRRNELRHHLRQCPGCSEFREQLRHQRKLLAAALPVMPTVGLKSSVLASAGIAGGTAGAGGAAAGGVALGSTAVAKLALVGAIATGGVVAGEAVMDHPRPAGSDVAPAAPGRDAGSGGVEGMAESGAAGEGHAKVNGTATGDGSGTARAKGREKAHAKAPGEARAKGRDKAHGNAKGKAHGNAKGKGHGNAKGKGHAKADGEPRGSGGAHGKRMSAERSHGRRGAERRAARSRGHGPPAVKPGKVRADRGNGIAKAPEKARAPKQKSAPSVQPTAPPSVAPPAGIVPPAPGRDSAPGQLKRK